jgi:2-polyprenyl-3-methyl-5-hydroxy-6-metoxy-1,4-benzoquinol methylase
MGTEKNDAHYDKIYAHSEEYEKHYSESIYHPLWERCMNHIWVLMPIHITELGCGSGQFADMLMNSNLSLTGACESYVGYDFSEVAIEKAKERDIRDSVFKVEDILQHGILYGDTVICMETLEHIERDLDIIKAIPKDAKMLITVPDFDYESHVRFFSSEEEVMDRYAVLMSESVCEKFDRWFILSGTK